ncbi:MAG: hypothetical protein WAQ53_12500 [Thiofilum sp.]|uniref:hypothetical protein n=1 Tax=Thiofilum sp. TaxID=2212733 RepID=UPI0025D4AC93|nr:hypothetical protein [Thiofilum sp.]MBK8454340.1 hypothetical protein [Thiofilum sp.]
MSFNCFVGSYATNSIRTCSTPPTTPTQTAGSDSFKTSRCASGGNWFQGNTQNLHNVLGGLVGKIGHHSSALGTPSGCGTDSLYQNVGKEHCGSKSHGHTTGGHHLINSNTGLPDNNIANEPLVTTDTNLALTGNQASSNSANNNPIAVENANSNSAIVTTVI